MIVMDGPGSGICDCSPGNPDITVEEAMANARLIAAAPEMYEALKRSLAMMKLVAEDYSMGGNYSPKHIEILFSIRSAIAKAEGRQP